MSIGMVLLIVIALLILFGALQRVLDRMALTDRQALVAVAAILIGGWLPDIPLGVLTINIGGALIPFGLCVYLFIRAGSAKERIRSLAASALNAAAIYGVSLFFPADPTQMPFDPMLLYGVLGGAIGWLLGRSRKTAFMAGVLGVILSDALVGVVNWSQGIRQTVHLGGAGALDAIVISGLVSVLLCELFGEWMERMITGRAHAPHEDGAIEGGSRA